MVFEAETSITLPAGYKEFFQIFGPGMLGNYMRINYPNIEFSNFIREAIKDEIQEFPVTSQGKTLDVKSIETLLKSAFVFGDNADAAVALWDIRTYSESDKSYDIYLARSEDFNGDIYQVGRDIFEFVRDFCFGIKSYEVLPEWMHPRAENLQYTFTRF